MTVGMFQACPFFHKYQRCDNPLTQSTPIPYFLCRTETNRRGCLFLPQINGRMIIPYNIVLLIEFKQPMTTPQSIQLNDLNNPLNNNNSDPLGSEPNEDESLANANDHVQRPSTRGAFRPVRNGNIKGSIFAMLASALGTGCLNLPIRASQLGIIPFILIMFLAASLSYLGMYMMEKIIIKYKIVSYSEMVKKAYGERIMRYAEAVLILFPWGFSICLQVIFAKFVCQILSDVMGMPLYLDREREIYNAFGNTVRVVVSVLTIVLNLKNFFKTDLGEMLHSLGKFSVTGVVICMSFIVLTAFSGFSKTVGGEEVEYRSIFTMDYSNVVAIPQVNSHYMGIALQGLSGIFFTFLNHQFIFPLISHLKRPTKKRVDRIFVYSHLEEIIIYLLIGILGYVLLSQHSEIPISSLVVTSIPTWPLLLGKIMIAASLFFNLPLQIFAAREYLYESLDMERNQANMRKVNIFFIGSTFLIGLFFQGVSMYFGLIGGTVGVMMAGGIPLMCFYKLIPTNDTDKLVMAYVGVMAVVCFLGAMQSIFNPA